MIALTAAVTDCFVDLSETANVCYQNAPSTSSYLGSISQLFKRGFINKCCVITLVCVFGTLGCYFLPSHHISLWTWIFRKAVTPVR